MKNPSRTYPGGIQTVIRFLIDFVILTVIGFACGTGKAHVGSSNGAARRPNGLAANYAFGAVILGVQRSLECFNQFFTVVALVWPSSLMSAWAAISTPSEYSVSNTTMVAHARVLASSV